MKRASHAVTVVMLLATALLYRAYAQDEYGEESRINTNLGVMVTAPLNPMARFVNVGGGFVGGAGYNFSKHHSLIGEFMWNRLGISDAALAEIRSAAQNRDINGHGDLFVLTGNYRFELRGKTTGAYFIAGGGWYHRTASLSTQVETGASITCTPTWLWWGAECEAGTVISNQTLASSTSDALGVNGGIGITFKVAEPKYRVYIEARYHYAPNRNVNTQLIPITFGIRF